MKYRLLCLSALAVLGIAISYAERAQEERALAYTRSRVALIRRWERAESAGQGTYWRKHIYRKGQAAACLVDTDTPSVFHDLALVHLLQNVENY